MKNSNILVSVGVTLFVILAATMAINLWRGLGAIRRFPEETVKAMQPVLERTYNHKDATGQWPASLDDVGMNKVIMPRLARPSYEVVDEATAQTLVHGPGHQFLSFTFFENENLREAYWTLHGEGGGGEISCPKKPW